MFQVRQETAQINSQVFPASTWEGGHFSCFFTIQTLDYRISKNVKADPCGFICNNSKGTLNKSAKFQ